MSRPGIDPERRLLLATEYAKRGWRVVLLHGIDPSTGQCDCSRGADCPRPGKHPVFNRWQHTASTNKRVLASWFKKYPTANIGIVTGREFGVVVDLDPRHGSDLAVAQMKRREGPLPETLMANSGGGGEHQVFAYPEGLSVRNDGLPALKPHKKQGVDVKGDGGYIVVEPSVHYSGGGYEWATSLDAPLAHLPDWMLDGVPEDDLLVRPDKVSKYGWVALMEECAEIRGAEEGCRHDRILISSRKIGNLVGGKEINKGVAFTYLEEAACEQSEPLDLDEIRAAIADGLDFGAEVPRTAPPEFTGRDDALAALAMIGQVVRRLDWEGHKGKRMYEVLMGHVRIATRAGGPGNYRASLRNVAMEMGTTNHKRVIDGQDECQEAGWLTMVHESLGEQGRAWRLKIPRDLLQRHTMGTQALSYAGDGGTTQQPPVAIGHDAFREKRFVDHLDKNPMMPEWWMSFRGLGKTRYRMCDALWMAEAPMIASEIARALGVARSTVTRNLPLLVKVGLVAELDGRFSAKPPTSAQMAGIAARLSTAGAALQQREDYEWDTPVAREDLSTTEAAAVILPETDPNPLPPARKDGRLAVSACVAPAVPRVTAPSGKDDPDTASFFTPIANELQSVRRG